MHIHLHLKKCICDHGPAHSFWCFSFERYNSLLGSYHTNQKNIEVQIMHKFINSQILQTMKTKACPDFLAVLQTGAKKGSAMPSECYTDIDCLKLLNFSTARLPNIDISFKIDHTVALLPPLSCCVFSAELVKQLEQLYLHLYPQYNIVSIPPFYSFSGRAILCGEVLGSVVNATSCKSASIIMAYWPLRHEVMRCIDYSRMRVGCVQHYCKHQLTISAENGSEQLDHIFAFVQWKERHPQDNWYGSSATICFNSNEPSSKFSFIPVQRIYAIGAHCLTDINVSGFNETVFVVVPIPVRLSL